MGPSSDAWRWGPSWCIRNTCIHFGPRYQIQYMYLLRACYKIQKYVVCVSALYSRPPPCARGARRRAPLFS